MRLNLSFLITFLVLHLVGCAQEIPNKTQQISRAVLAAPKDMRDGATVLGYDANGKMVSLREGTNSIICVADDPNQEGFNVACYHKDLEPFMKRGRELRAEGKNRQEVFDTREAEMKAGKLEIPAHTTLHVLAGKEVTFDPETGEAIGANYRSVIYIPFATAESTGLPTEPQVPGGAWIMEPGTHRAHIMVVPPKVEK